MHTGDLCFFTGASLFIVGVVGYFFTGLNNKGVYLLSSFVFFVVNVISVCMLPDNFLFLCGAVMNQCAVPVVSMAVSTMPIISKRKLTAVCSHQTRIGNLDAHLI